MKKFCALVVTALCLGSGAAMADNVVGAVLGGAAGAVVGNQVGGTEGAVVGGVAGGLLGVAASNLLKHGHEDHHGHDNRGPAPQMQGYAPHGGPGYGPGPRPEGPPGEGPR
ncbi:glycine zipper 2TM domain-containing protein [Pseudomonas sp. HR96]|uniref:glycine zipper 2TM domain-containing protein n=1 Tax=Pseudomonas sp. HR96 TaxID=1027966 RepID=UPI002A748875|nr:glycine zipper 2TM domain-containing protein [Pseudomonas sp. HR96]WPO97745.1 glycine zipper 2TM domain-containing protein [Pseudomonas sp. HR96]